MKRILAGAALAAFAATAQAQGVTANDFYFGAGLNSNELDGWGGDATGYQFFGGLDLLKSRQLTVSAEVGYWDSGEFEDTYYYWWGESYKVKTEADGIWANGVASFSVAPSVDLIGRAGFDFGDDDGFMFGAGAGINLGPQMQIRGEYVVRDHIDSLQANFVYHL